MHVTFTVFYFQKNITFGNMDRIYFIQLSKIHQIHINNSLIYQQYKLKKTSYVIYIKKTHRLVMYNTPIHPR